MTSISQMEAAKESFFFFPSNIYWHAPEIVLENIILFSIQTNPMKGTPHLHLLET